MVRKKRPERREFTAFHEASHTLVAHMLGWDVPTASIAEEEGFRGYTVRRRRQTVPGVVSFNRQNGERPDDGPLPDRLIVLFAGVVAERLFCAKRGVSARPIRLGHDIREARESVRHLPKEKQLELLGAAEERALELLSDPQNWQIIEQIATKLLEVDTLDELALGQLLPTVQNISPYAAFHRYAQSQSL